MFRFFNQIANIFTKENISYLNRIYFISINSLIPLHLFYTLHIRPDCYSIYLEVELVFSHSRYAIWKYYKQILLAFRVVYQFKMFSFHTLLSPRDWHNVKLNNILMHNKTIICFSSDIIRNNKTNKLNKFRLISLQICWDPFTKSNVTTFGQV
jgi:hypothetical protein